MIDFETSTIALVGPLPPPHGGMANQTKQLARLLESEGAAVNVVRTNAPYRPRLIAGVRGVRALFRFVPYLRALRRAARDATLFHVMANSGWAWHLFAAPALYVAHTSGVPVVLNYRGGDAERFFTRSYRTVERSLRWADDVIVPSQFLKDVFEKFGARARVVPNIIDLDRFRPSSQGSLNGSGPRVLIARNLEPIYDIETGIRAFATLRGSFREATLDVAGSGPERKRLEALAGELGLSDAVRFLGRVDNVDMPRLYAAADIALNTSLVDNMPISVLEALASGVPIVSTDVGGVPALVEDEREALLVPPRDPESMARTLVSLWRSPEKWSALRDAGLKKARTFGWDVVREQWAEVYREVLGQPVSDT